MSVEYLGIIYILENQDHQGNVIIGYTKNLNDTLRRINQKEPSHSPYKVYATYDINGEITNEEIRKYLYSINSKIRLTNNYYDLTKEAAYFMFKSIAVLSRTERRLKLYCDEQINEQQKNITSRRKRRSRFRFKECGIPIGSKIVFYNNDQIIATVVDNTHVEWAGEIMSLSKLAEIILDCGHGVQGPLYFKYNGKLLTDIRDEVSKKGENK